VGITDYLRADDEKFLSPDHLTLAEALRQAGYVTALIGKWHLTGDYTRKRGDPSLHGFHEVICSETSYIGAGDYFAPYEFMPEVKARTQGEYLTDRLDDEAVAFLRRHGCGPFFLYLSHYAVHTKLAAKPEMVEKFAAKPGAGKRRNNPVLAAMLASIDDGVGRIIAALEELKIADKTVVIFTSDNGGEARVTSNAPLRGGKSQLYEGGIRVPLIISGPVVVRRGRVCDVPVSSVDYYPTCLELADVKRDPKQVLDGESLVRLLKGTGGLQRGAVYWHYPLDTPHFLGGRSAGAVRFGHFKLIEFYDTGEIELYDLETDVGERANLATEMPERTAELRKQLRVWRARIAGRGGGGT
jgi:arylsulfatase A